MAIEVDIQVGQNLKRVFEKLVDILIVVSTDLEIGLHHYHAPFENTLHVPYFTVVYTQYDSLVSPLTFFTVN